jgi:hypothetical protein
VQTGRNNIIVGGYRGTSTLNGAVVLSGQSDPSVGIRWTGDGAGGRNAVQSVGTADAPLTDDGTMSFPQATFFMSER